MWAHRPVILAYRRIRQRNPGFKTDGTAEPFPKNCSDKKVVSSLSPPRHHLIHFFFRREFNKHVISERALLREIHVVKDHLASWPYILDALVNWYVYKTCIPPHPTSLVPSSHFTKRMRKEALKTCTRAGRGGARL